MRRFFRGHSPIYRDWTLLQLAAIILATDQLTKFVTRQTLELHQSWPALGFFRFTHIHNTGSAFGLFQDQNLPLIFVSLAGILALAYIYHSQARPALLLRVSIALMLGGAVGNLIDRIHQGHVTDFADIGPWPVFNVADSAIVIGLLLLAWLLATRREQSEAPAGDADATPLAADDSHGSCDAHGSCPVCDGPMIPLPNGARCADCGVRERILSVRERGP